MIRSWIIRVLHWLQFPVTT